jgi:hypothetical protein
MAARGAPGTHCDEPTKRRRVGSPTNFEKSAPLPASAAAALRRRRRAAPEEAPLMNVLAAAAEATGAQARRAPTRRSAKKPRAAPFPAKLFEMVSRHEDVVRWNPEDRELVVADPARLASELMPRYFTVTTGTGLVKSFARQLNYYGFHRVGSPRGPGGRAKQALDGGALVFANRDPRVETIGDLATLVRHEKPPARAVSTPRAAAEGPVLPARVVTPPSNVGTPGPWTLDVGSLLREAAAAAS